MRANHRAALPKKETLTGRDLRENFRAALPAAFVSRLSGGRPGLRYPFFPAGLFFQKSPAKYFCEQTKPRRRAGAAVLPKRVPELSFWFFFFHRKKKNEKTLRKEKRTEEKKKKSPAKYFCEQTKPR